jgi:hypothetical protein
VAGPGQLHIQPVDVFCAGEPDQGPAPGQALGAVPGGHVGQIHPPVALSLTAAIQIRPGQRHRPAVVAVQAQAQGSSLDVKRGDDHAAPVGHPQLVNRVVTTDDPVPHRQLAVLDPEPVMAKPAAGG